ncbi:MAG: DUF2892 domain-containing protein [Thermodesulfobacteriota bacterium]
MRVEKYLRLIAGVFVLISLVLSRVHSEYWLLFTAFVGLNLLQSGFTNWCLMKTILERVLGRECSATHEHSETC